MKYKDNQWIVQPIKYNVRALVSIFPSIFFETFACVDNKTENMKRQA